MIALLVGLSACSSVTTTHDSRVNLAKYHTYQWVTQAESRDLNLQNPPTIDFIVGVTRITRRPDIEGQLQASVDKDMKMRGFALASANPDFYVTYFGRAKDQDWVSTFEGQVPSVDNVPIIAYPGLDRAQARTYRDGTIMLVFYDAKTKAASWNGSITGVLTQKGVDVATVERNLLDLTREFPS